MDEVLLMGLTVCTLGGFVIGAVVGVVLGHDIAQAHHEHDTDLRVDVWREDIDNPEGEWHG
jgi:hypothetical protein